VKIQLLFFAIMFATSSCADQSEDNTTASGQDAETVEQAAPAPKSVGIKEEKGISQVRAQKEEVEMHEDRDSQLSKFIMDGSSEAAFEESLKQLQETAPTDEYRSVKSAIQYLLVYDLNTRGNKEKLYAKLNGKTPDEIIAMAKR